MEIFVQELRLKIVPKQCFLYIKSITNYYILKHASTKCIDHRRMLHADLNILAYNFLYRDFVTKLFRGFECPTSSPDFKVFQCINANETLEENC